jgi:hypothetical protein
MDIQTQIDRLIELAIVQRTELKQLVEQLPELREHLNAEVERTIEEVEPQLRAELEEFCEKHAVDANARVGSALEAKIVDLAKSLEQTTQARYNAIKEQERKVEELRQLAEKKIEGHVAALPEAVKEIVDAELARFPRAGEIDQLRKEFAEPRGLNPRGKWQSGETYNKLDLVAFNGDSFVSNIDGNIEKPNRGSAVWTLSAARGVSGGGGGATSLTDLVPVPQNGELLIGNGSAFVNNTLTAGTGITITNGAGSITIDASGAQETLTATVKNAESVAITKGQVVYLFSATGGFPSVKLAYNTSDATSAKTFGVVSDTSIAPNGTGTITCVGVVSNLNLGTYSDGDTVYLGATPGSFTATKPYAPNHLVYVGIIERANAGNGELYVRIQNGYELDEIHDVQINAPKLAGQTLIYDQTNNLWKNARLTAGVGVSISNADSAITISADGGVNYQGTWNASTNTPTLTSSVGTKGFYYVVSVAGSTNLNGVTDWKVGDWAIFNGTAWEKVDTTDQVSSVFGRTGAVVGVSTDYSSVGITNTAIGASNPSTGAFTTLSATSASTTQGVFSGWNSRSGANALNGQVIVGSSTFGLRLMGDASGTGGSIIDDLWDSTSSSIQFRLRGSGTAVTGLTLTPSTATFGGNVTSDKSSGASIVKAKTTDTASYASFDAQSNAGSLTGYAFGSTYSTSAQYIASSTLIEASAGTLNLSAASNNAIQFWTNNGATPKMTLSSAGNLTVSGGTIAVGGAAGSYLDILQGGNDAYFYNRRAGQLIFGTNNATVMQFPSTGNCLIGTTTDGGYKLDVNGTARIQSNLTVSGTGTSSFGGTVSTAGYLASGASSGSVDGVVQINRSSTSQTSQLQFQTAGTNNYQLYTSGSSSPLYIGIAGVATHAFTSGGNVGIGTTSPSGKLTVYGGQTEWGATSSLGFLGYTGGYPLIGSLGALPLAFYTNGTEKMRLTDGGNLGLGVTPSAWNTDYRVYQLAGGGAWFNNGGNTFIALSQNLFVDTSSINKYIATAAATRYRQSAGEHFWDIAASGTAGNTITFTQAMTLTSGGNILLGRTTTEATIRLDVSSPAYVNYTNSSAVLRLSTTDSQAVNKGGGIYFAGVYTGSDQTEFGYIGGVKENSTSSNYAGKLVFGTRTHGTSNDDMTKMTLTSSGNLLIGTTTDGGARLQVSGDVTSTGTYRILGSSFRTRIRSDLAVIDFTNTAESAFVTGYIQGSQLEFVTSATALTLDSSKNATFAGTVTAAGGSVLAGGYLRIYQGYTPSSSSETATAGTITWDTNYIYVATAANTWKRAALSTW